MATTRSRRGRRAALVATVPLCAAALLSACGSSQPARSASTPPSSALPATSSAPLTSAPVTPTATTSGPTSSSRITKLLVVVVENHSLDAMRQEMPYTFGLAQRYGYATGYHALTHPSLPNYLALTGGDTYGVTDDRSPAVHALSAPSVFGQALSLHRTAKVYAEDMTGTCAVYDHGRYAVRHNPWTYHVGERASCGRYDVPMTALDADVRAGALPDAGMVVPNLCDDAHDCQLGNADTWMRTVVGGILAGPDFASGHLLVVITADEDHKDQSNLVLTTLLNPQLHGAVVTAPLDHYSLARLYSEVLGAPPLARAASAPSIATAFKLRVGP